MESSTDPTLVGGVSAATPHGKADLGKRFAAALIDGLIGFVLALVLKMGGGIHIFGLGLLIASAYFLVRDGLDFDFMDGRSIGKKLMKLRLVRLDSGTMDLQTSLMRNWPLALGSLFFGLSLLIGGWLGIFLLTILGGLGVLLALVEAILVLVDEDGRRLGDKQAQTLVVDAGE